MLIKTIYLDLSRYADVYNSSYGHLCGRGLRQLFDFPKGAMEIEIQIHDRKSKDRVCITGTKPHKVCFGVNERFKQMHVFGGAQRVIEHILRSRNNKPVYIELLYDV